MKKVYQMSLHLTRAVRRINTQESRSDRGLMLIAKTLENSEFVTEKLAQYLTPRRFKRANLGSIAGYIFIYIICVGLYFPLIIAYFRQGNVLRSILLFIFLSIVVIALLETADKDKIERRIVSALKLGKQVLFGILFSILVVILSQEANTLRTSSWIMRMIVSISLLFVAFLVGTGFYLVLCIPHIYSGFLSSKFNIPTLLPYQTVELKRIAEISSTVSLIGAIISGTLSSFLLGLAIITQAYLNVFWVIVMISALILSWVTISIPFFASQLLISRIIRQAKEDNLSLLQVSLAKAKERLNDLDEGNLLIIEKIQGLYDKIYSSPNTVLDWGLLGKYLSALTLALIPTLIGILLNP
jgi:hypothetical protein